MKIENLEFRTLSRSECLIFPLMTVAVRNGFWLCAALGRARLGAACALRALAHPALPAPVGISQVSLLIHAARARGNARRHAHAIDGPSQCHSGRCQAQKTCRCCSGRSGRPPPEPLAPTSTRPSENTKVSSKVGRPGGGREEKIAQVAERACPKFFPLL